jgi:hypothetical protein
MNRDAGDSKTPIKSGQLSSEFYMKGDVMWFISIKKVLKENGIKGYSRISDLGILPSDEMIFMELRVAIDDTIFSKFEGQEISEGNSGVFNFPKKQRLFSPNFCTSI